MSVTAPSSSLPAPRLAGDLAIWFVVGMELATFGLLFAAFAFARRLNPAVFAQGQGRLELASGAVNTALLIGGSWCVARAVHALREDAVRAGSRWLLASMACAGGFLVLKSVEFGQRFAQGIDLETDTFWTLFILLTGFHYLHVVAATVLLLLVWWRSLAGDYGTGRVHAPETVAVFWHMVDLLWLVLFPLVYVLR